MGLSDADALRSIGQYLEIASDSAEHYLRGKNRAEVFALATAALVRVRELEALLEQDFEAYFAREDDGPSDSST